MGTARHAAACRLRADASQSPGMGDDHVRSMTRERAPAHYAFPCHIDRPRCSTATQVFSSRKRSAISWTGTAGDKPVPASRATAVCAWRSWMHLRADDGSADFRSRVCMRDRAA